MTAELAAVEGYGGGGGGGGGFNCRSNSTGVEGVMNTAVAMEVTPH